jgi:hypothetical protein
VRHVLAAAAAFAFLAAVSSFAMADGASPGVATPVQRVQAQARFARGRELMAKKQFDQALAEFRASHEIVTSPNTRLEIARCLRAMGRTVAAYAELGRAAVEAKELVAQDNRYQRAYDSAMAERGEMEPQLGFVSLVIENPTGDTKVTVGGEEIRRAAWNEPAPVLAGSTAIVVSTEGHAPVSRRVELKAGQRTSLSIDALSGEPLAGSAPPEPPPPPQPVEASSSSLRTWAYVAGGVGVTGLVVFTVGGLLAQSTYNDLNRTCPSGPCPADKASEISSGKTQQTIANVGLGVGLVGVAAGTALFLLSRPKAPSSAALVVSPGWMGMKGSF